MNLLAIYEKYRIMPQLQEHQLRVAGVACMICDSLAGFTERREVLLACLLHDMGNIIKFDLSQASKLAGTEVNVEYWQEVKKEYIKRYGPSEHEATLEIARDIGVGARVVGLADCVGFSQAAQNAAGSDFGKKICAYSDMRVSPFGVVSLAERMQDLRRRYGRKTQMTEGGEQLREKFENALRDIEKQIFFKAGIQPADITSQSILRYMLELKNVEV